ncbi:hypothetical protein ES707_16882 [subsurface metagenome]
MTIGKGEHRTVDINPHRGLQSNQEIVLIMSSANISQNEKKRNHIKYLKKYLLATEAFSQATAYLVFALICVWVLTNDSPKPSYEFVILSIAALLSVCMFLMFTLFMFTPERVDKLRKWIILPSPSDSKIKKTIKSMFPVMIWLILFIIFLDTLFQGASRMPDNARNIVMFIGAIWLIVIPLASLIKLSFIDGKILHMSRYSKFWGRVSGERKNSLSPSGDNKDNERMKKPNSLEPLYNLALKRLEIQNGQIDTLQTKAGVALSIASVMIGVPAVVLAQKVSFEFPMNIIGLACVVIYLMIVLLAISAFSKTGIKMPSPRGFYDMYSDKPSGETKSAILFQSLELITENTKLISEKNKYASLAIYLLPVEVITIVVYISLCLPKLC